VKSRALKPPKLLHIIPLKAVEISDRKSPTFHLTHKIQKKKKKLQRILISLSGRIQKNIQKICAKIEKSFQYFVMQDVELDPRPRAILPKTFKKRNYFRRNKKELYQF
jgi:hypothetical protein